MKYLVIVLLQLLSFLVAGGFVLLSFLAAGNLPTGHDAHVSALFNRSLISLMVWILLLITTIVFINMGHSGKAQLSSGLSLLVTIGIAIWAFL
jgi:hypothetical protein